MRLINARTLQLEEFVGENIPPFFVLSHRWSNDEITFKDFMKGRRKNSIGYRKIVDCCQFVLRQHSMTPTPATNNSAATSLGFYVWVDTCCIDKRSSAELSEAINSMFLFYRDAVLCIVHLSDVCADLDDMDDWAPSSIPDRDIKQQLAASSWFTRGWTLQELLAPEKIVFLDRQWQVIGTKGHFPHYYEEPISQLYSYAYPRDPDLEETISQITNIDTYYLHNPKALVHASIAQRMSWAAYRTTLRIEDTAYSLLGLFDVNMPLLYGEGSKAFLRLQEELIRRSNDQSIFVWRPPADEISEFNAEYNYFKTGILAPRPRYFQDSSNVVGASMGSLGYYHTRPYPMTNSGLELRGTVQRAKFHGIEHDLVYSMRLNCARALGEVNRQETGPPILIAFWHIERDGAAVVGYNRLMGADERLLEEMIEGEDEPERKEERVLYVTPLEPLVPILTSPSEKS